MIIFLFDATLGVLLRSATFNTISELNGSGTAVDEGLGGGVVDVQGSAGTGRYGGK